jgi:hypothetical protein
MHEPAGEWSCRGGTERSEYFRRVGGGTNPWTVFWIWNERMRRLCEKKSAKTFSFLGLRNGVAFPVFKCSANSPTGRMKMPRTRKGNTEQHRFERWRKSRYASHTRTLHSQPITESPETLNCCELSVLSVESR